MPIYRRQLSVNFKWTRMASENSVPRKVNFSTKHPLRRSLSTTSLGLMLATHLNLRDTKSYTGGMETDAKSESSEDADVIIIVVSDYLMKTFF